MYAVFELDGPGLLSHDILLPAHQAAQRYGSYRE
jgi:hypothetical protein